MRYLICIGAMIIAPLFILRADTPQNTPIPSQSSPSTVIYSSVPAAIGVENTLSRIQDAKTRGIYDDALWQSYLDDPAERGNPGERLDQGGETIATATLIPALPYNDVGQTIVAINDYYEDCNRIGPNSAGDVVYRYNPALTETVDISLCSGPLSFDSRLYVYQNIHTPGNPYACSDDDCNGLQPQILGLTLHGGNSYYIVVDGWGSSRGTYALQMTGRPSVVVCPCPLQEQEPNDVMPPSQIIQVGQELCGVISHPLDTEIIGLTLTSATPIRVTLEGNAGRQPCPGGRGLHPSAQILSEYGEVIAYLGDSTNQATQFTSDFALGGYPHVIKIAGANGTVGPWILRVDPIPPPTMAPPAPQVTLYEEGGSVRLRWQRSYLPGEFVQIDVSHSVDGPYGTIAFVPGALGSWLIDTIPERRFFKVTAIGERPADPFIGSMLTLAEPGPTEYEDHEVGSYQIVEIEWGVNANNEVGIARLLAHGVGPSAGELIMQDNRNLFDLGVLTPVSSFAGRKMNIFGRDVLIEHVAFARDPETGEVEIADGRGRNPSGDSLMYFHDAPRYLIPNTGATGNWVGFWWWDQCPGRCCRLAVRAFCRSTGLGWAAACAGWGCPGNPACWLGCPCEPDSLLCTPIPPGCAPCQFVYDPRFPLIRWCMCAAQTPPPPVPRCFFQIFVKCKIKPCRPDPPCFCPGPCVGPPVWTLVPFVNSAMHAACRADCSL